MAQLSLKCKGCGQALVFSDLNGSVSLICQNCGGSIQEFIEVPDITFECAVCGKLFNFGKGEHNIRHQCSGSRTSVVYKILLGKREIQKEDKEAILILRNRGLGDLLMLTPAIRELKKNNPSKDIYVVSDADVMDILKENPDIKEVLPYTANITALKHRSVVIDLQNQVEDYKRNHEVNKGLRIHRFMELCGLDPHKVKNAKLVYNVLPPEQKWAASKLNTKKPIVALGLDSYARFRNWDIKRYQELVALNKKEIIWLLLSDIRTDWFGVNIINATGCTTSVRSLAALVGQCSAVVCGDSGISHICAALDIPNVILYGAIPPEARCSTYKFAHPIYKKDAARCIPCWDRQFGWDRGEKECNGGEVPCMQAITAKEVLAVIHKQISKGGSVK